MVNSKPLNAQQIRFCDEYLTCFNVTQAATKAGYSPKNKSAASVSGWRLMQDERVQAYLAARLRRISDKLEVTTERILLEMARVAFSNPRDFFNEDGSLKRLEELSEDASAVLSSIDNEELFDGVGAERTSIGSVRKIRMWDKVAALDKLAKISGMYPERNINVKGTLTARVIGLRELLDEIDGADTGIGPASERAGQQTDPPHQPG